MVKEVKMYEAKDGKMYKTKKGAENHDKKISVDRKLSELKMTKEEIQKNINEAAKHNKKLAAFNNAFGEWTEWRRELIDSISPKLWETSEKTTQYVKEVRGWGKMSERVLFTEKGPNFTDPELHTEDEWKVDKVEEVNEVTKKIYYVEKYTIEELAVMKLKKGEKLAEGEISEILWNNEEVYVEEGEDRRWSKSMLTVVKIDEKLYAIEWEKGLTEMQEDEFYEQPYPVNMEKREVVTIKTFITRKDEN